MAARRSNKRKRRNRGRFGFLYKFLSIVTILVVIGAGCVVFFRVGEITVAGESKYAAEDIVAASGVELEDNLCLINPRMTERKIVTALPYIDEVNVHRALPDRLVITVTERAPAAVIQGDGGWWIIDKKGKILDQASSPQQPGTARITGLTAVLPAVGAKEVAVEEGEELKLSSLLELLQLLTERDMLSKVSEIDLSSAANLLMTYDGRITVKMRMNDNKLPERVAVLAEILEKGYIQENEVGTLDLTLNPPHFIP